MTVAVLVSLSAKDAAGRILGAWVPVMFFVVAGFSHSIADMTYCALALFARDAYGGRLRPDVGRYFREICWVTLGNIGAACWRAAPRGTVIYARKG